MFSPALEMHQGIDTGRTGHYCLGTDSPVFSAEGRSVLFVAVFDKVEKHQVSRQCFTAAYWVQSRSW